LEKTEIIQSKNEAIIINEKDMTASARGLLLKSVLILPLEKDYYLYIDSGTRQYFNEIEISKIKTLGILLKDYINNIGNDDMGIIGQGIHSKMLREYVFKYALEEDPVIILGETGVGKSYIAELIHQYSGKPGKFVVVDSTVVQENLFESEVFGHKKGSFTGAFEDKVGFIDEAENGTIFFDEIAEVPPTLQAKLLRLIETKKYRRVGDPKERIANIRIIAATNKNLEKAVKEKQFREDLYFRLNVLKIEIQPLRNRKEDIKPLIEKYKTKYLKGKTLEPSALEILISHNWPGNIRELINTLISARVHCTTSHITGDDMSKILQPKSFNNFCCIWCEKKNVIREGIKSGKNFQNLIWQPFLNKEIDRDLVKEIIYEAYIENNRNFKKTLEFLNAPNEEYQNWYAKLNYQGVIPQN
jgi:DNA-binding NtrC family response regulator